MMSTKFLVSQVNFNALKEPDQALFAEPEVELFSSLLWYQTLAAHTAAEKLSPRCVVVRKDDVTHFALPVWCEEDGTVKSSLSSHYSFVYRPLFASGVDRSAAAHAFGGFCEKIGVMRFDELDAEDANVAALRRGLVEAKFRPLQFDHFGNWYQPIPRLSFLDYMLQRPRVLRSTITRKLKSIGPTMRFDRIRDHHGLTHGIHVFKSVYAKSWKREEPFLDIHEALIRALASQNLLRLGLLFSGNEPIAAQFWAVSGGVAMLHKLAHDKSAVALSPGTVLTALMIRSLMEEDMLLELDFGRGDDPYKRLWASQRRQRIGIMFANSRRLRGWIQIGVTELGRQRRRLWASQAQVQVVR
jgi:hypothetical protein